MSGEELFDNLPVLETDRLVLRQQIFEKGRYRDMKIYSILRSEWERMV